MSYPIPREAFDDRIAIVGTAGSGKTYLTMGAIEHLLARKSRVIGVDPLGVMWGLRLCADGKTASPFQPVIFGGAHGDLPISEHSGALIGEAVAASSESCIIDLSLLGAKAAERRFMLAFLTALYRYTNKEPVHLVIDEADMFAPQRLLDKDGDAAKLLGMMETIVRRGRVKGFIPWLITQRPAVLSKDVLSQADGLVALKLTAKQDRDAIKGWVESTADQGQWKTIDAALPTKQRGEGVLWMPARGILADVQFPAKATFDSSRTPKRGEKISERKLAPLDLGKLKDRLATVETEAKANDPKALKAEVAKLKAEIGKLSAAKPSNVVEKSNTPDLKAIEAACKEGYGDGFLAGWSEGDRDGFARGAAVALDQGFGAVRDALKAFVGVQFVPANRLPMVPKVPQIAIERSSVPVARPVTQSAPRAPRAPDASGLSRPQQAILDALAWMKSIGLDRADRPRTAMLARASHKSSGFENNVSRLKTLGFISYPVPGELSLTQEGDAVANAPTTPPTTADLHNAIRSHVSGPQWNILAALCAVYPDPLTREELAERAGASALSSGFENNVSAMKSFGFADYPSRGMVAATPIMFIG